ncbi:MULTISPECIES: hypothetical protein [unclassified Xanthobacter]|uniref:hypothetical protein n=1 Tax=unclassified Xanthobacter TaxID=2623496 RepID=UPI001F40F741|nr:MULTISPECIES: hypothetical protein [unclassified Xanthobacter]
MGKRGDISIELKEDGGQPVFLNLATPLIREIERGHLKPGDALPGTRAISGFTATRSMRPIKN